MPWKPVDEHDRWPTLGYYCLDWIYENLTVYDGPTIGQPLSFTQEQANFVLRLYEVDPAFNGPATHSGERHVRRGRLVRRALLSRPKGWGKLECMSNVVPTPSGWTTIGELQPGDKLFGADGSIITCLQVHPVQSHDAWRVTLSDGSSAVFGGSHEFDVDVFVGDRIRIRKTLTVGEMRQMGLVYPRKLTTGKTKAVNDGVGRFALPPQPVLQLPDRDLPMDPYLLGLWLGDGDSDCPRLTCSSADLPFLLGQLDGLGCEHGQSTKTNTAWRVRFGKGWAMVCLRGMGVLKNKHIPAEYLRASQDQRLALLQGLMDTDGCIDAAGRAEFCTTKPTLADGVAELIRTLGMKVNVCESNAVLNGRVVGKRYRLGFKPFDSLPVFRMPRKAARLASRNRIPLPRVIRSIEPVADTPMRCITVSATDGLYLTGQTMWTTHNSPLVAALCLLEALGDVVMDGYDAAGQPVGRPWHDIGLKPLVQIVAVSEDQTANTWMPCIDMARNSPVYDTYNIEPMETFINVPRGRIEAVTSAGLSREGFRPIFTAMDQTESWIQSNGGWRLARTIRRNTMKTGGLTVETPNAFEPGEESIAEQSWHAHQTQLKGKNRSRKRDLLLDHREGSANTDVYDHDSLKAGLLEAYGDSAAENGGWVDLEAVIDEYYDPNTDPQEARRFFLNQITHASDSFLSAPELAACVEPKPVKLGSPIVLGFDGSMGRAKGMADATALIACRLSDGYMWQVLVRQPPDNPKEAREWTAPVFEFDVAVQQMFRDYKVVGFYADPTGWEAHVSRWEEQFGRKLKVRGGGDGKHPIMAWPRGKDGTVTHVVKRFKAAVLASGQARTAAMTGAMGDKKAMQGVGEWTYDGSHEFTQHLLNARMRKSTTGYLLAKDFPESRKKIDSAYAAVLAFKAYLDCVAKGLDRKESTRAVVTLG